MKPAAVHTLILVTGSRASRFDADGGLWSVARPAGQPLAESVRAALSLGGSGKRQVVVLSTDLWTQTLSLNRGQVAGLSKSQLEQALTFEAEPFSGLPALESVLGAVESGARDGSASFWVSQCSRAERAAVQDVVAKEGGHKFLGLGHPGGMPTPMKASGGGGSWRRIECWDGAWLLVSCDDGRHTQVKVLSVAPADRDLPQQGRIERLHARFSMPSFEGSAQNLAEDSALSAWCQKALGVVTQHPDALPWIAPEAPPPSARRPVLAGGLLAACALVFAMAQGFYHGQRKQAANALLEEHKRLTPLIDNAKKAAGMLETELEGVRKSEQILESVNRQRTALPLFMEKLAQLTPESVVVRHIKVDRGGMLLSGVALEAAAVDDLGIQLTSALKPVGYLAQPVEKKARQTFTARGVWDFTLAVMPQGISRRGLPPELIDN